MKKPLIGIIAQWQGEDPAYFMNATYTRWIEWAGGLPVILPYSEEAETVSDLVSRLDGLLFAGGPDISPDYFGEALHPCCGTIHPERDAAEKLYFDIAYNKTGIPIMGICRGCQVINIFMGGTIYQDLYSQKEGFLISHRQGDDYVLPAHEVKIVNDTPLHKLLESGEIFVNTFHHQAIRDVAEGLTVMATAADGVVEAVYEPGDRFVWGIQWHPERFDASNADTSRIFNNFVDKCSTN